MAADVALAKPRFDGDIDRFRRQLFITQALLRSMPVAMKLRSDQSIVVKAGVRLPPGARTAAAARRAPRPDRRGGCRHAQSARTIEANVPRRAQKSGLSATGR
jgi:hypothetical protein